MIYLSPSTQEKNIYADKTTEEVNMNKLVDDIARCLKPFPYPIYRNDPKKDALSAIREANQRRVKLHLALHTNAGGGSGVEVFYDPRKPKSKQYALHLVNAIAKALGIPNRGIKDGSKLIEIRAAHKMVNAVLVELFFHDNAIDLKKYRNNYKTMVNEIAWQTKVFFANT